MICTIASIVDLPAVKLNCLKDKSPAECIASATLLLIYFSSTCLVVWSIESGRFAGGTSRTSFPLPISTNLATFQWERITPSFRQVMNILSSRSGRWWNTSLCTSAGTLFGSGVFVLHREDCHLKLEMSWYLFLSWALRWILMCRMRIMLTASLFYLIQCGHWLPPFAFDSLCFLYSKPSVLSITCILRDKVSIPISWDLTYTYLIPELTNESLIARANAVC